MIPGGKSFCTRHYKKVTHCLFDLDGTLLDSEVMYHTMIGQICEKYGKSYSKDNAVQIFGMTDREVSEEVCARTRLPLSVDEFERQLLDLARNKLPIAPEKPGADRLLTHLFDYKVPMALATNSTEQSVRLVSIARPKLFGMFNHMWTAASRTRTSTSWRRVASRTNPSPHNASCSKTPRWACRLQSRLACRSLRDFKPELFGLPPFNEAPPSTTVPIHHS
ncbi:probable pseudouridine-5'-phosphatase isoform X6 [Choristoneura fumiferana]|uniref:probable pseudouridine-5'-phosphatase isoform X6 n=1 Tax=Choristoneura fumiferana TaxID=7141 RepID=UPI003D15D01B